MEQGRFPNKLKRYRRIAGYSQKKVAKLLGFSDASVISRWEHGVSLPSLLHVFKLSRLYDALPHELFNVIWYQTNESLPLITQPLTEEEI